MGAEPCSTKFALESVQPFSMTLSQFGLNFTRSETTTLQVNVGFLCNQVCKHWHLGAGTERKEIMGRGTVEQVLNFAGQNRFQVIDITGGAPELNTNLPWMIEQFFPLAPRIMLRTNLTALYERNGDPLLKILVDRCVVLAASFPSLNAGQLEAQRGTGNWEKSLATLRRLNVLGYGKPGSGLELNLVCNPTDAFMPASQKQLGDKFRSDLQKKWGIVFSNLYALANAPLGRFRQWLIESGNFEKYITRFASTFNQCAVDKLMC